MDNLNETAAFQLIKQMATTPEQQQMIQYLETAPPEQVLMFLQQSVGGIPRDQLIPLMEEHMGSQIPNDQKQNLYTQVVNVYDFLKQQQQTAPQPNQ